MKQDLSAIGSALFIFIIILLVSFYKEVPTTGW